LKLNNGTVTLTRIGRGGAFVSLKNGDQRAAFDLADFVIALRQAAKVRLHLQVRRWFHCASFGFVDRSFCPSSVAALSPSRTA